MRLRGEEPVAFLTARVDFVESLERFFAAFFGRSCPDVARFTETTPPDGAAP